jgi:two-component system chemotaxis sensor kinase CheA
MDDEIIREFLVESNEGLARLEQDMLELEKRPDDAELLASVFRAIHTIKGTCGFLGFDHLRRITHITEHILSQLRERELILSPPLVSLILETVDAIKAVLETIAATGTEGRETYGNLCARLKRASQSGSQPPEASCASAALGTVLSAAASQSPHGFGPASPPAQYDAPRLPEQTDAKSEITASPAFGQPTKRSAEGQTLRMDVALFDRLRDLAGELSIVNRAIQQRAGSRDNMSIRAECQWLNLIASEIQQTLLKARMQPMNLLSGKLQRLVRHLAISCGKQIALELEGIETELEKTVIDAISDPLTHLVRNACDHGIEDPEARVSAGKPLQAKVSLRIFYEGDGLNIEIKDDGRGIDVHKLKQRAVQNGLIQAGHAADMTDKEALDLVFLPGLSTAEEVTTISGRGVGMDVVRTNVERLGGRIRIATKLGRGTTFRITIPTTLSLVRN